MVEWSRDERDMLERIVALLLALAGLADRAAGMPAPVRLHVLGILGFGAAEARGFVVAAAPAFAARADGAASPAASEAERLASCFRALAFMLGALLAEARRLSRVLRHEAARHAAAPISPRGPARPVVARRVPVAPDTS